MKKSVIGSLILGSSLCLLVGLAATDRAATGLGNFHFGEDGHGIALFDFNIVDGAEVTGSLLFAAEDHHSYPDIIIRVPKITDASFDGSQVRFTAKGAFHDDPVDVVGKAIDRGDSLRPDWFFIKATSNGEVVFEAEGDVHKGNIVISQE